MVGNFFQHPESAPDRIDLDFLTAGCAAQQRFPSALEAELPDLIARMIIGFLKVIAIDFADVAEQMRRERSVQIMACGSYFETDAGKFQLMSFQRDDLAPIETLIDGDGIVFRAPFVIGRGQLIRDDGLAEQLLQTLDGM